MSRKHGPARGVRGFVRRFLQRPGTADLRRAHRIAAAAAAKDPDGTVPAQGAWGDTELASYLAVARAAAEKSLDERPFDVQMQAAAGLLTGHVVEMATGEGKTLSGAMAAAGYALQGKRVHVISVNDYLAQRDAEWMGPLYEALGVSVGWIGQSSTPEERRAAYAQRRDVRLGQRDRLRRAPRPALHRRGRPDRARTQRGAGGRGRLGAGRRGPGATGAGRDRRPGRFGAGDGRDSSGSWSRATTTSSTTRRATST